MKPEMKQNLGKSDRVIRTIVGTVILMAGYYNQSLWGLLGIVVYFTAAVGWCPLYRALSITSCAVASDSDSKLFL